MSAWGWFLQRVSAVLVFLLLGSHLWLLHYVYLGERITFERVVARVSTPLFFAIELGLLAAALYHALYGVRGIAIDYRWGSPRAWTAGALAVGVAGFLVGTYALTAFLG